MMRLRKSHPGNRLIPLVLLLLLATLTGPALASPPASSPRDQVRRIVIEEAVRSTVAPTLALAVAKVESDFDATARSHANARGVMQIVPQTALDNFNVHADALWDPRLNARIGISYLEQLIASHDGHVGGALSQYRLGSVVNRHPPSWVVPSTRSYVDDVLGWQQFYERDVDVLAMIDEAQRTRPVAGAVSTSWPAADAVSPPSNQLARDIDALRQSFRARLAGDWQRVAGQRQWP